MRFVYAILAFVLAALMIGFGIMQRTVFLEPASTSMTATVGDGSPFAVIDGGALGAFDGSQTLTVSGADSVFVAYGRTADVKAWIGADDYAAVGLDADARALDVSTVTGEAAAVTPVEGAEVVPLPTNPAGSDLWLEEFSAEGSLTKTINVPEDVSVLIASDGSMPAPTEITVAWPTDNSTPWAGPLIVGGALVALIGFVIYLLALIHLRRSRRPRRNVPRGPRMPKLPKVPRPKAIKASEITGSRRAIGKSMIAVPVVLVSGLVLSGCSPEFWPTGAPEPAGTGTATSAPSAAGTDAEGANADGTADPAVDATPAPAVTVPQLERIVGDIVTLTGEADAGLDADSIATRFTGPALEQRLANYKIRTVDATSAATTALPDAPLTLTLPQQTDSWPREVMTVLQSPDEASAPTMALVLKQASPRENYLVEYAIQLGANAKVPGVAPATIGAVAINPDNKFMSMAPDAVGPAYADVLLNGEASPSYPMFEAAGDTARTLLGPEAKQKQKDGLEDTATMEFSNAAGSGEAVALATNDSGSIVAVSVNEITTVTSVNGKATIEPTSAPIRALSGIEKTSKGIQSTYGEQYLFHVPAAGSSDKIVLLGFSHGLISSVELP